jgi:putative tricarboxylic transport membrane protein
MMSRRLALRRLALPWLLPACPAALAAGEPLRITIGANPGGGFDQVARSIGLALQESGDASTVHYENKGGAGGMIALAQFVSASRGDPGALIVSGAVMVGAILRYKPPVTLAQATPIARLMSEYNTFVVPASSPLKTMRDVVDRMKRDAGSIKWGGGSKGSVDHLSVALVARAAGVPLQGLNYVPFKGGGEATAALLGGHVAVAAGGWGETHELVAAGTLRALAITAPTRLAKLAVPTLREQGLAVDIANWRGLHAAPGISPAQREALTERVVRATRTGAWTRALAENNWTADLATGEEFERFVADEHTRLGALMRELGLP